MLNKRGIGQEVDWIIGIGLFITSILFIILLFRPGIQKVYNSETLLSIVQDGFNNETEWSMTTVPLFIQAANNTLTFDSPSLVNLLDKKINVSCDDKQTICTLDQFNDLKTITQGKNKPNIQVYYVKRDELDANPTLVTDPKKQDIQAICNKDPRRKICGNISPDLIKKALSSYNFPQFSGQTSLLFNLSNNLLALPLKITNDKINHPANLIKTKYLITLSDKAINFQTDNPNNGIKIYQACSKVGDAVWPYNLAVSNKCQLLYELGVTEKVSGISLSSFLNINETKLASNCEQGYECLKEKWKFPENKEFKIDIESLPIGPNPQNIKESFPEKISAPKNINIFARQFNTFLLTEDGILIPVKVRITVW